MKKILALLLLVAMLVPMGLVAGAEEATEVDPYFGHGWCDLDNEKFPNLTGMARVNASVGKDKAFLQVHGKGLGSNVQRNAAAMKEILDALPEGQRYFRIFASSVVLAHNSEHVVYMDNGTELLRAAVDAFVAELKAIGAQVDGIILDTEYVYLGAYYITTGPLQEDATFLKKIVDDPRYAKEIRPELEARGFPFWENVTDLTPEIYTMHNNLKKQYPNAYAIWNTVMRNRLNNYSTKAILEPLLKYYPDAIVDDYQSADGYAWLKSLQDSGDPAYLGGNSVKVGNVSNHDTYGYHPGDAFHNSSTGEIIFKNPAAYNEAVYERNPFNMLLFDVNRFRQMIQSTDTEKFTVWITDYDYANKNEGSVANTPYYAETIIHLGLMDPETFLIYMNEPDARYRETPGLYEKGSKVISEVFNELTDKVGAADRKAIRIPDNWNTDFVLSGMTAGGKNIWRITPNTDEVSLEAFKVEGSDPTFSVKGQTVTFPGGKVIADGQVSEVGTCGYWVETAADVAPVITNDENRFENHPSFEDTFEQYAMGTELNLTTSLPAGVWSVTRKSTVKPKVVATENGQALSLNGTVTLKNQNVIANITAGDTYAEDQAWQVTVQMPENMGGELLLLYAEGKKASGTDGGFRVAGGKVYVSNNGNYEELSGVSLSAGKYTFKRVVNFNNAEAFTASYYVYDASGKLLGSAGNVPMVTFTLPATTICVEGKELTAEVLMDDYKLYPTGFATDFELYDATYGALVQDTAAARNSATAYRLSWLNGTGKSATATVMAAVYEGQTLVSETVVKELTCLPGCDGVETGIVSVAEGQTVKVYLKADKPVASDTPGTNGQNPGQDDPKDQKKDTNNILLIIIVSVTAVLVLGIGAFTLVMLKKPAKKLEQSDEKTDTQE